MINFIMYSGCIGYKLNFSMYIEQWSKIKCIDLVFVFPQTIYSSSVISWNFGVLLWIQFKVVSWNIALLTETYPVLFLYLFQSQADQSLVDDAIESNVKGDGVNETLHETNEEINNYTPTDPLDCLRWAQSNLNGIVFLCRHCIFCLLACHGSPNLLLHMIWKFL